MSKKLLTPSFNPKKTKTFNSLSKVGSATLLPTARNYSVNNLNFNLNNDYQAKSNESLLANSSSLADDYYTLEKYN